MTAKELYLTIGLRGSLAVSEGLIIDVIVTDAKVSYGQHRLQVRPVAGQNSPAWVAAERVLIIPQKGDD